MNESSDLDAFDSCGLRNFTLMAQKKKKRKRRIRHGPSKRIRHFKEAEQRYHSSFNSRKIALMSVKLFNFVATICSKRQGR